MSEYLIQGETLTGIADAIRAKTGSSDAITVGEMATAIGSITSGGSSAPVAEKEVNFYDYDGALVYSYTVEEAQALTELPAGPEHPGLVFQKWNWSLENVKALTRAMNIGALYTTDDGTTRLYIHLEEGRTSPMLGVCPKGTVTVDWGDGTTPDVLTGTSTGTVKWTPNHEYAAPGDYVIRLTVDGSMWLSGSEYSQAYAYILRYNNSSDNRNYVYHKALRKVEIGNDVTIGPHAFFHCESLSSVVFPGSVTIINRRAFDTCYSLRFVVIPDGVKKLESSTFKNCSALSNVAFPYGINSIGASSFNSCYVLKSIAFPDSMTSNDSNMLQNCYSLRSVVISNGVATLANSTFYNCNALSNVAIPYGVNSIEDNAFNTCSSLGFIDFSNHTSVPTLSATSAFYAIPADCEIRVPTALYDEWIAATNWSTYASRIVAV